MQGKCDVLIWNLLTTVLPRTTRLFVPDLDVDSAVLTPHDYIKRAGLHTGEVEVRGNDVAGMAVHIASRIMDQAAASEALVSSTVKDLVIGSGLEFDEGRLVVFKGIPNEWTLHSALDASKT